MRWRKGKRVWKIWWIGWMVKREVNRQNLENPKLLWCCWRYCWNWNYCWSCYCYHCYQNLDSTKFGKTHSKIAKFSKIYPNQCNQCTKTEHKRYLNRHVYIKYEWECESSLSNFSQFFNTAAKSDRMENKPWNKLKNSKQLSVYRSPKFQYIPIKSKLCTRWWSSQCKLGRWEILLKIKNVKN